MQIPDYYLKRPALDADTSTIAAFERLFADQVLNGGSESINYTLPNPKWQFVSYLADTKDVVMHGSGDSAIAEFEPRQPNDTNEFGNQLAVYAASDAIWAMYFAIVDRDRHVRSLVNSCVRLVDGNQRSDPYYYFSINQDALPHNPWREGSLYVLPRETFEQEPMNESGEPTVEVAHWRSFVPVRPLAKIPVTPADFPFLD